MSNTNLSTEGSGEGGSVLFQKNYDKENQRMVEEESRMLIQAITGYCTETGIVNITEAQAVSYILAKLSSILQTCDMLYIKYHEVRKRTEKDKEGKIKEGEYTEGYKLIMQFKDELIGKYSLNGTNVVKRLQELIQTEVRDIAVRHKLMDRIDSKEPWEREVGAKFFLE